MENAGEAIPKIFEVAKESGVRIVEVKYHRPTLNDVFLHLTGREIRDEGGEFFKKAIARARMRR